MAKSTSRPPRKPTPISASTPFNEPAPAQIAAEDQPRDALPPEPEPEAPRTFNNGKLLEPKKIPTFLQTMNKISKADWGARANIYLYRVEPIIDRTRSGDSKFVNVYAEPISEDRIMADYGSGRYKLMLNFRKAGADTGDLMDSMYVDILNMKYPPKIPLGEWVDDPRNKKWAWAKEASQGPPVVQQPAATGVETFVDVLRATGDIRREIREEMQDNAPTPAPAVPVDPWSAAEKILNMRSDNPMVTILMNQLTVMQTSAEAAREREFKAQEAARQRELELQKELRQQATAAPSKGIVDQLLEIASNAEKLKPLKEIFGFGGATEAVGRTARTTGMDILNNLVSGPAGAQLAQGLGHVLMSLPSMFANNGNPANGTAMPHPPPVVLPAVNPGPPQPETPEQRIQRIGEAVTRQMLGEFFMKNAPGQDFAASMYNFWPEDTKFLQSLGADDLVARYRRFPQAWAVISYREADFIQFMTEFCAWTPEDDEGPAPSNNGDDGVVDLEAETPGAEA